MWLPSLEPSALRRAAKRGVYAGWLAMARVQGYFDPRLLGLGTAAEPLEYVEQLVRTYEKDRLTSVDGAVDYMAALSKVRVPVLSVSSEGDRLMAHPAAVERFIAGIERGLVTARVVRAGEAGEKAPGHMGLVMSEGAKGLWREIGEWVLGLGQ